MNTPVRFWRKSDKVILWQIKDGDTFLDTNPYPLTIESWI